MGTEFKTRCPRQHESVHHFEACEHGAERVSWLRNNPRSTQQEEDAAPGCPWAIDSHEEYGNCWWKFMEHEEIAQVGCSEDAISKALHISIRQVREIISKSKRALLSHPAFQEMKDLLKSGDLFVDTHEDDADLDFYTPTSFSFVEHNTRTTGSGEDDGTVAKTEDGKKTVRRGPKITPLVPSPDV